MSGVLDSVLVCVMLNIQHYCLVTGKNINAALFSLQTSMGTCMCIKAVN